MKKYKFSGKTITVDDGGRKITLHQIQALIDFSNVRAGDVGGWIECENNLSQNGDAWVYGNAWVYGDARVCGNARVYHSTHLLTIGAIGSRNAFTTFYRDKDGEITVKCGCFCGKIEEFLNKVKETHGDNKHAQVYRAAVELAKLQIDLSGDDDDE